MSPQSELIDLAKSAIGSQYGLTEAQSRRLRGSTASELRADANAMRRELGMQPLNDRDRDEQGRFASGASMNEIIRQASGRR